MSPIEIVLLSIFLGWGWGEVTAPTPPKEVCPQVENIEGVETVVPYACDEVLPVDHKFLRLKDED